MRLIRPLVLLVAMLGLLLAPAARAATPEIPEGVALPILLAPAPALLAPAPDAQTTGNPADPDATRLRCAPLGIPTFSWENTGASKYELEIATTQAFGDSIVLKRDNLQYPTYAPTGMDETGGGLGLVEESATHAYLDSATFYWHVRAWDDAQRQWGSYSPPRSFTRHWGYLPALLLPEDGTVAAQMPFFSWEPVPGASYYQIQVDTSDSFGSLSINDTTDVPAYTPADALANDDDLFWRVRAFHGSHGGPWSAVRQFKLAWASDLGAQDNRPLLLTPPNNANHIGRPLFCWQPVAGAQQYEIDVATHPGFVAKSFVVEHKRTEGTCYAFERNGTYRLDYDTTYYWRVTALDARGNRGQRTDEGATSAPFQFRTVSAGEAPVPELFHPLYYYPPLFPATTERTFEDRAVAVPTFVWDNVEGAEAYELRLDDDPAMADPWTVIVSTPNASFTFTDTATYPLTDGQVYYWKVRAIIAGFDPLDWSAMNSKWPVRVDRRQLSVQVPGSVQLIQPTYQAQPWTGGRRYGQESVRYYPSFAWTAITSTLGAARYEFQIASDAAFGHLVHRAETNFTAYTPQERPDPGTYFWRVRALAPTAGAWSEAGRFIVSRNFTFFKPAMSGSLHDWSAKPEALYAPTDEVGDTYAPYDLAGLYISNNSYNWYLGLPLSPTVRLGLYLDTDHFDQSGALAPPPGRGGPQPPEAHQPEYAIYWVGDSPADSQVWHWGGTSWTLLGPLSAILGDGLYSAEEQFLELQIPASAIDMPGSLAVCAFSLDITDTVHDLLPNQPGAPQQAAFLTESTTPTPLFPANAPNDPALGTIERNTPVLTWRHNDAFGTATFFYQTFKDDTFSTFYESENGNSPNLGLFFDIYTHWAPQVHYSDNNSYNWRVFRSGFGPAAPQHFRKAAYLPVDLRFAPVVVSDAITYTNRTPDFSWQPAQSAPRYLWELYDGSRRIAAREVMQPYYTPREAVGDGSYTWKVWAKDARGRYSAEAAQGTFSKVTPIVPGVPSWSLVPLRLQWQVAAYAAYYRVIVAADENYSRDVDTYQTYNTTFTPERAPRALRSGTLFVRILPCDRRGNEGPWIDLKIGYNRVYLPAVLSEH